MTNILKIRSENTDKMHKMSDQPSFIYPSKFPENVELQSTEIGSNTANVCIKNISLSKMLTATYQKPYKP